MPTVDHLRTALNAAAADTDPLASAEVLRAGKRRRTRNRVLAGAGVATAVVGIALGATRLAAPPPVVPPLAESAPAAVAPSQVPPSAPGAIGREQRFVFGAESESETGVLASEITDRAAPADEPEAVVMVRRIRGESKLAAPNGHEGQQRTIEVAGHQVRVDEEKAGDGWIRTYEWISHDTRWIIQTDPAITEDGKPYGPDESDIRWAIEKLSARK